jgi:plasmid stabilization system protein ParE
MSHTKEPWGYIECGYIYSGDDFVADCRHVFDLRKRAEKDAKRIIACVNAMAGIENPEQYIKSLQAENKRLREALEEIAKNHYGLEIGDDDETAVKYWASRALIMRNQARAALDGSLSGTV